MTALELITRKRDVNADETLAKIWQQVDLLRDRTSGPVGPDDWEEIASKAGVPFDITLVNRLARFSKNSAVWQQLCPQPIVEFVVDYARRLKPHSVLDPWAGLGSLIIPVFEATAPSHALAISPNSSRVELGKRLCRNARLTWINEYPATELARLRAKYDLIVSSLPFAVRVDPNVCGDTPEKDLGHLLARLACRLLAEDGVALLVVAPGFFVQKGKHSPRALLRTEGIFVEAAILCPPGTFEPATGIESYVVLLRRREAHRLFVGELSPDPSQIRVLVDNLVQGRAGETLSLGRLVDADAFVSVRRLQFEDKLGRVIPAGSQELRLGRISAQINLSKRGASPSFEERTNALYIPLIGLSDAVTSSANLRLKPHNYAQVVVDAKRADATYLAGFLNTSAGRLVREEAQAGTYVPRLTKSSLEHLRIFLPEQPRQLATVEANTRIQNLLNELGELRDRLWRRPAELEEVSESLAALEKGDSLIDWLDQLPFPLASILWVYHAGNPDKQRKYEQLLHFFQATAQLLATIELSAAYRAANRAFDLGGVLRPHDTSRELDLDHPSFGLWVGIAGRLSRRFRELLDKAPETREQCRDAFCCSDTEILGSLLSADVNGVLQKANQLRNLWLGHTGLVGEEEATARLIEVEALLAEIRKLFGSVWRRYPLILPGQAVFAGGSHHYSIRRLLGSRTPFEHSNVVVDHPLEDGHLYFLGEGNTRALQLLPLIRIMPSPSGEANACYFYNRRSGDRLRFVSYHFDQKAEVTNHFGETSQVLDAIAREESFA